MQIFNIHGYQSGPQNSAAGALNELGLDIVSPAIDYDAFKPEYIAEELQYMAAEAQPEVIVGTSLGGFYALYLAIKMNLPVILVNPCLMPFLHLPRLGYEGDISGYIGMFGTFTGLDRKKTFAVIGDKDEVIDTHDMTKKLIPQHVIVPEGLHSGSTLNLPVHFKAILEKLS